MKDAKYKKKYLLHQFLHEPKLMFENFRNFGFSENLLFGPTSNFPQKVWSFFHLMHINK